uniref:Protein kinase domain-containing protein n=1 Tax=Acrobeloides nanus TaxID=290746 RepID=A0A914DDP7_9BILA
MEAALGRIPYIAQAEKFPYDNLVIIQKLIKNFNVNLKVEEELSGYSKELKDFIKLCLQPLSDRPTYEKLMKIEFYQTHDKLKMINTVNQIIKDIKYHPIIRNIFL